MISDEAISVAREPPSIAEVQRAVAEHFGTSPLDMLSQRRSRVVARPRQVAMYLCSMVTLASLAGIGRHFGGRDHSTVCHAIAKIKELAAADPDFGDRIATLRAQLDTS